MNTVRRADALCYRRLLTAFSQAESKSESRRYRHARAFPELREYRRRFPKDGLQTYALGCAEKYVCLFFHPVCE